MMKKTLISMACAAAMAAPAAQAEFSANIGVTSDYLWRGFTQSGHEAAVSGGLDYSHNFVEGNGSTHGFYAGTWLSSLGNTTDAAGNTGTEVDGYLGLAGEIAGFGYDVGYIYYAYMQLEDFDFSEIYANLSWNWLSGGVAYTVDSDAGGDDDHIYGYIAATLDLGLLTPQLTDWSTTLTLGTYDFDGGSVDDYDHAQLDITKSAGDYGDFTFTAAYVDNLPFDGNPDESDTSLAVSWTKTF